QQQKDGLSRILFTIDTLRIQNELTSRFLGGAAGIGNGFRPSVFQAVAERYLKFRTPSPAVLLQLQVILSYLQNEKLCVLVFTNMAFCLAFLTGRLILRTFFGDLRMIERQHMYDRALNFLLFKVVFGVPFWSLAGKTFNLDCLVHYPRISRVFSMLCRDRFEFILSMLTMILVSNIAWFYSVSRSSDPCYFLSFECFTLFLDTVQTLTSESRRMIQYYTEFVTDTMILVTTWDTTPFMYLHGISFTLIDAVLKKLAALYPSATEKELEDYSDDCAICRDSMASAKVLHVAALSVKTESNRVVNSGSNGISSHNVNRANVETAAAPTLSDIQYSSRIGPPTATPSLQALSVPSSMGNHSSSSAPTHNSASGNNSNRSSTGHQLFTFNSEQQPWLSRLGFQESQWRSTDEDEDEDLRRAIAESLALSQLTQSQINIKFAVNSLNNDSSGDSNSDDYNSNERTFESGHRS
ncbi:hypothetical protein BCR41DRAFT_357188, partial [Lobosporangium transversale]